MVSELFDRILESHILDDDAPFRDIHVDRRKDAVLGSKIQHTLLWGQLPENLDNVQISAQTIASQSVGGDFFDFIRYDNFHWDMMIGDVMGKGGIAALLGAGTKSEFFRTVGQVSYGCAAGVLPDIATIVNTVHSQICGKLIELSRFVTACYVRFNLEKMQIELVDCGHTKTVHYRHREKRCDFLKGEHSPLGFDPQEVYEKTTIDLGDGDILFFYSDGITEAVNTGGDMYGAERLARVIEANADLEPENLTRRVHQDLTDYALDGTVDDDLTYVTIKIGNRE
ncbi:MAG: serine/threonine-protein phosphatase [Phycisphaerae bacterium]|nr:serine/threonine-protein phosphatase [Phycisphaerae bacterium]